MTLRTVSIFTLSLMLACASSKEKDESGSDSGPAADADADTDADADADADADTDSDTDADDTGTLSPEDCEEDLVEALTWMAGFATTEMTGEIELGQTHVVQIDDDRWAPKTARERATLVLFTPTEALASETDLRLRGILDGEVLGVLAMNDPSLIPQALEQDLTTEELDAYSTEAWSTVLPWHWVKKGLTIEIAHQKDDELHQYTQTLEDLAAPHVTTITRSKIVLFGEEDFDTTTMTTAELTWDFFPTVPGAELRIVDSMPWVLDYFVVNTADGPRRVTSEGERLDITSDGSRWNILKHQMSLRLSVANTGRGLVLTEGWEGDDSPYSFGTSLAMGWVRNDDGSYDDINNAGLAAGWTGWTGLWAYECDNGFIHEIGHSFSLLHFTSGTAYSWGIADQYPYDGRHVGQHPAGYDTLRDQFRTWYRVDASGPVWDGSYMRGKSDPMNGGESANAQSCFPQFIPYQAWKIQNWAQGAATITSVDGAIGLYAWNEDINGYFEQYPAAGHQQPIAIDVPTATLIGTMGNVAEANQSYPPIYTSSGNVFDLPDPTDPDLPDVFNGAQYLLEITHADGSSEQALIASGEVTDTRLMVYALNLDLRREPTSVDLFFSPTPYPSIDLDALELLHTQAIDPPALAQMPKMVTAGRGAMANGTLSLSNRCEPGINCNERMAQTVWRESTEQIRFRDMSGESGGASICGEADEITVLSVPVVNEEGTEATVIVHAQRVVHTPSHEIATRMSDVTPWIDAPNLTQGLRVWIPWDENASLAPGTWSNKPTVTGIDEYIIEGIVAGDVVSETPIHIELQVLEQTDVDLASEYTSPGYSSEASSFYYLLTDAAIGPTERVWWGGSGPTVLTVPVRDVDTDEPTTMRVDSWKLACGDRWDLNAGQSADWGCDHQVVMAMAETGNEHLVAGHSYQTTASDPVIIEGRRWHAPDAEALIHTFAFHLSYTASE